MCQRLALFAAGLCYCAALCARRCVHNMLCIVRMTARPFTARAAPCGAPVLPRERVDRHAQASQLADAPAVRPRYAPPLARQVTSVCTSSVPAALRDSLCCAPCARLPLYEVG